MGGEPCMSAPLGRISLSDVSDRLSSRASLSRLPNRAILVSWLHHLRCRWTAPVSFPIGVCDVVAVRARNVCMQAWIWAIAVAQALPSTTFNVEWLSVF